MRRYLKVISYLIVVLVLHSCAETSSSRLSIREEGARGETDVRPASERTIYQAMGRGLMGDFFDPMAVPDRRRALAAEYRALEYGKAGEIISWQGTNTRLSGEVVAGQPYRVGSQDCRQYRHNFSLDRVIHNLSGSACRNKDGSWSPLI